MDVIVKYAAILGSYAFLGGSIKYIDQAYDLRVFNKISAVFLAMVSGTLMGVLVALDAPSTTIFMAVVIGVSVTRKVDNYAFYVGVLLVFAVPVLLGGAQVGERISWAGLFLLLIAGMLDEELNNISDQRKIRGILAQVFYHRFIMKFMVLALAVFGFYNMIYFIAFLLFDLSYIAVDKYSKLLLAERSSLVRGYRRALAYS